MTSLWKPSILSRVRAWINVIWAGKCDSQFSHCHSTTSFSENVVVAKTSYQMLGILSFRDRWEGFNTSTEISVLSFVVKKKMSTMVSGVSIFREYARKRKIKCPPCSTPRPRIYKSSILSLSCQSKLLHSHQWYGTENLTAKTKRLTTKPKTSRQNQNYFVVALKYWILPWGFWFCRWVCCFCREVFVFAVRFLVLPWQLWATIQWSLFVCIQQPSRFLGIFSSSENVRHYHEISR